MTVLPAQVTEAIDFFVFLQEFRQTETINWKDYEERLLGLSDRLFSNAECENHFAAFDNSFAFLSPDIVYDIVAGIETSDRLKNLVDLKGTWGLEASERSKPLLVLENQLCSETVVREWNKRRWGKLYKKAPKLSGKLQLENLCGWIESGKRFYSQLRPLFTDIDISYHILDDPFTQEELEPLRMFLVAQLNSPHLKNLKLKIKGDLQLEEELLAFCSSKRCESLTWDCNPLSVTFFVQVHNALQTSEGPRKFAGFIEYSAQTELVDALKLKRKTPSSHFRITSSALSEDQKVLLKTEDRRPVYLSRPPAVDVCIEIGEFPDFDETALSSNEHAGNGGPEEDDEEDFDDYWERDGCYCELEDLSDDNWREEDCEDCKGCIFCKLSECQLCGYSCGPCTGNW